MSSNIFQVKFLFLKANIQFTLVLLEEFRPKSNTFLIIENTLYTIKKKKKNKFMDKHMTSL